MRTSRSRALSRLFCLLALAAVCSPAPTQQDNLPRPRLRIQSQTIRADITGRLATTTIEQVYVNEDNWPHEAVFSFRLPEDGVVHDLAMWINGVRSPAVVYPRVTASEIYREIVEKRRDPAILEYVGDGVYNLRVFPIPANGTQKVQIVCTHVLSVDGPRLVYKAPRVLDCLNNLDEMAFTATIRCPGGAKDLRSSTHDLRVDKSAGEALTAGFRAKDPKPRTPISLSFVPGSAPPDPLVSADPAGGATFWGHAPSVDALLKDLHRARDFVIVLDTSASMANRRLEYAKGVADKLLATLDAKDRFSIVTVASDVTLWRPEPCGATQENTAAARQYIAKLNGSGGTDLAAGLRAAEAFNTDKTRPCYVVLITDGDDLVGAKGLAWASDLPAQPDVPLQPPTNVQLHCFCVVAAEDCSGALAGLRGAKVWYVDYDEDVPGEFEEFRQEAAKPAVENLKLTTTASEGMDLKDFCCSQPRRDEPLMVAGRYAKGGQITIQLTALVDGQERSVSTKLTLPEPWQLGPQAAWASGNLRKIRAWRHCDQIWRDLQKPSAKPEELEGLVALSRTERVVTRATAFLILENRQEYISRGIEPPGAKVEPPHLSPEQATEIAEIKARAKRFRKAGQYYSAAVELEGIRAINPVDFQAFLEASILREFTALDAAVAAPPALGPPRRGPWQVALVPLGVADVVPAPLFVRPLPKPAPLPNLGVDPLITRKLQQKIAKFEFDDIELKDVIAFLHDVTALNIQVKWNALQVAGLDDSTSVNVRLRDVTVDKALRVILDDMGPGGTPLDYEIEDGVLTISTRQDLDRRTWTYIYDVRDLVFQPVTQRPVDAMRWGFRHRRIRERGPVEGADEGRGGLFEGGEAGSSQEEWGVVGAYTGRVRAVDPGTPSRWGLVRMPALATGAGGGGDMGRASRRVTDIRDLALDVSRSPAGSVPLSSGLMDQLISLIRDFVPPASFGPGGEGGTIRDFRGLLIIKQTRRNHLAIRDLLTQLRAFNPAAMEAAQLPPGRIMGPESMFTRDATLAPWVLALLKAAREGKLSKFSSVLLRKVGDRTFARIGGIWLDLALTDKSRIALVMRDTGASAALLDARADLNACFALGNSVVVALRPEQAVSLDEVGISDAGDPALKKILP